MLLVYTEPEKRKNELFQIVPCVIDDLSWKFHENPCIPFTVILLADTPLHLDGRPWNNLVRRETV